jgi:hypothetical protein
MRNASRLALLSALVMLALGLGLKALISGMIVPRMLERGNVMMIHQIVGPLESYFADYQAWPAGAAEETNWRLQGAKDDVIGETSPDQAPTPPPAGASAAAAMAVDPAEAPSIRRERQPVTLNYLRDAKVRSAGLTLADAWGHPLEFSFIPTGPATVTSLGPDAVLGTDDDVSATANIQPRSVHPTRSIFLADREFRLADEIRRLERARKLQEQPK